MDFHSHIYFKAYFLDGSLMMWERPQTFTHVFKVFKDWAESFGTSGALYCGSKVIRITGNRVEVEAAISKI